MRRSRALLLLTLLLLPLELLRAKRLLLDPTRAGLLLLHASDGMERIPRPAPDGITGLPQVLGGDRRRGQG